MPVAAWCSFIRWTGFNCVFLLFWVHAHNAIPFHREMGAPESRHSLSVNVALNLGSLGSPGMKQGLQLLPMLMRRFPTLHMCTSAVSLKI